MIARRGAASGNLDLMKRALMATDHEAVSEHFYINESDLEPLKIKNENVKRIVVEEVNMLVDVMLSMIDNM